MKNSMKKIFGGSIWFGDSGALRTQKAEQKVAKMTIFRFSSVLMDG